MTHDGHLSRVDLDRIFNLEQFVKYCGIPNLDRVVLTSRDKEVGFLGCEADTGDIFIVSGEHAEAPESFILSVSPHSNRVVLGSGDEQISGLIDAEYDVRVCIYQGLLDLSGF